MDTIHKISYKYNLLIQNNHENMKLIHENPIYIFVQLRTIINFS